MLFVMSILLLWTSSCDSKIEILNGENQVRQYLLDEEGIEDENIVRIFNIEEDYFYILESASLKNTYYLVHFVKIDDEKFRYYDESAKLSIEGMEEGNLAETNYILNKDKTLVFSIGFSYKNSSEDNVVIGTNQIIYEVDKDRGIFYTVNLEQAN